MNKTYLKTRTTFTGGFLWLIVIVLAVAPIAYFLLRITILPISVIVKSAQDQAFLDSAMGNWFATMVGLITGVPIGFWINRRQQTEQEKTQREAQAQISKDRKTKILNLIKKELTFNRDILADLIKNRADKPGAIYVTGMKDVLWSALSDGGELQWIDNLELLDSLADAYYHVRALIFLEREYFDPYFHTSVSTEGRNTYAGERVVRNVENIRPGVLSSIETAMRATDSYLASMK